LYGASYGGYLTLATLAQLGDRVRCAVDVVGISDFVTFLENTQEYRRDLRRAEYGDERDPAMREYLRRISPLSQVSRIRKPLLIAAGANDPRVPLSESEQIVQALRKQGNVVWYVVGRNEGHGFARRSNVDFLFLAIVQFLQQHLTLED
jgi:dipeptidyl aminopeptidase/acylaminoacyl peptidase